MPKMSYLRGRKLPPYTIVDQVIDIGFGQGREVGMTSILTAGTRPGYAVALVV